MKWVNLSDRAKFRLSGPDRVRYLNGQVTNQVDQDLSHKVILACACNLKGKIEGLVSITAVGDDLLIDVPAEQRESLFMRLDRYLIADDCEFEDVTDEWQLWHCLEKSDAGRESNRFGAVGDDVWIPAGEEFSPEGEIVEIAEIERIRIEHGFPKWNHELTGNEFPAEVGLDKTAVDFHKGCYLGQEIVSRIESVGKVKRSLIVLSSSEGGFSLKEGEELVVDGVTHGKITSVAQKGSETVALALVKRSFTDLLGEGNLPESLSAREISQS